MNNAYCFQRNRNDPRMTSVNVGNNELDDHFMDDTNKLAFF
jgi:hypothetical protein